MHRIYVGGAGGAPSNNFIRSLRESGRGDYLIGASCVPTDLFLADVDEKHVVPRATSDDYRTLILALLEKTNADFIHVQNDYEVSAVSRLRDEISQIGVKYYLPDKKTVEICVNKDKSYDIWQKSGVRVPKTFLLHNEHDLKNAFEQLGGEV
jgi:carbamoyl-phosphate synthase large subunit